MTSNTDDLDLESRIKARRAVLLEKLGGLRGDVRPQAIESRSNFKARLTDLAHILEWGVDDWQHVKAPVANKLEQWLADSAHQLVVTNEFS